MKRKCLYINLAKLKQDPDTTVMIALAKAHNDILRLWHLLKLNREVIERTGPHPYMDELVTTSGAYVAMMGASHVYEALDVLLRAAKTKTAKLVLANKPEIENLINELRKYKNLSTREGQFLDQQRRLRNATLFHYDTSESSKGPRSPSRCKKWFCCCIYHKDAMKEVRKVTSIGDAITMVEKQGPHAYAHISEGPELLAFYDIAHDVIDAQTLHTWDEPYPGDTALAEKKAAEVFSLVVNFVQVCRAILDDYFTQYTDRTESLS